MAEYLDANPHLFSRRQQLVEQLRSVEADTVEGRRVRRELDAITYKIFQINYGLVRSYVCRFTRRRREADRDIEAAGRLGLMLAIASFDADRGAFSHWAFRAIRREVLRAVREIDFPTLSMVEFERRPIIVQAAAECTADDSGAIAAAAGVTESEVERALGSTLVSLSDAVVLRRVAAAPETSSAFADEFVEKLAMPSALGAALAVLDQRERDVLTQRYCLDDDSTPTHSDIGRQLGVSREASRQVENRAIAKLRHPVVLSRLWSALSGDEGDDLPEAVAR